MGDEMSWRLIWKEHSKGYTQRDFAKFYEARDAMDKLVEYGKYKDFQIAEVPDKDGK